LSHRCEQVRTELGRVSQPVHVERLVGTLGLDPSLTR
jgi:hypothetical protein